MARLGDGIGGGSMNSECLCEVLCHVALPQKTSNIMFYGHCCTVRYFEHKTHVVMLWKHHSSYHAVVQHGSLRKDADKGQWHRNNKNNDDENKLFAENTHWEKKVRFLSCVQSNSFDILSMTDSNEFLSFIASLQCLELFADSQKSILSTSISCILWHSISIRLKLISWRLLENKKFMSFKLSLLKISKVFWAWMNVWSTCSLFYSVDVMFKFMRLINVHNMIPLNKIYVNFGMFDPTG